MKTMKDGFMAERIYVGTKPEWRDALGEKIRARIIQDLGIGTITSIRTATTYILNAAAFFAEDLTARPRAAVGTGHPKFFDQ